MYTDAKGWQLKKQEEKSEEKSEGKKEERKKRVDQLREIEVKHAHIVISYTFTRYPTLH